MSVGLSVKNYEQERGTAKNSMSVGLSVKNSEKVRETAKNSVSVGLSVKNNEEKKATARQMCNSAESSPCSYRTLESNCKKQREFEFECEK